jgi:hypothetical protein
LKSTENNLQLQPQHFLNVSASRKESCGFIQLQDEGYIDGSSAADDAFAKHFQSVYNNIVLRTSPPFMQSSELLSLAPISDPYVCKAIKKIKPSKSAGLDDTRGFVLKSC